MFVSPVANMQLKPVLNQQKADKSKVPFKGYYSGGVKNRNLSAETLKAIDEAAKASKAPESFVRTLMGASKGNFYNPTLEEDFIFSPKDIVDILKAYEPGKQKIFDYLSDQEGDMHDEERFSGKEMRDMYIASSKASLDTIKKLVNARNDNGYQLYHGGEIAEKLQGK